MSFRFLPLGLLAPLIVSMATSLQGQNVYVEICRQEASRAIRGSTEEIFAQFKLTDALKSQNLENAYNHVLVTLESAKQLDDPDFATVAKMQLGMIQNIGYAHQTGESIELESLSLTFDACPRLRVHFYKALIESELSSGQWPELELRPLLDRFEDAVSECGDPHLLVQQQVLDIYTRATLLSESVLEPELVQKREELRKLSKEYSYLDAVTVTYLMDSIAARDEKRNDDRIDLVLKTLESATDAKNYFYIVKCNYILSFLEKRRGNLERARDYYIAELRAVEELGSGKLAMRPLIALAFHEKECGNFEMAAFYVEKLTTLPFFENLPLTTQNVLQEIAKRTYEESGDQLNVYKHQALEQPEYLASKIELQEAELRATKTEAIILKEKVNQVNKDAQLEQESLVASHIEASEIANKSIGFLKKYAASTTFLLLILTSCSFLYVYRNRLRKVSTELDTERETSHGLSLRIQRMQRMESLGLLAGSVAHDFNNILVGVMGNAEILQVRNDGEADKFADERIANIIKSAEKAAGLSRQMLAYAGRQHIARQPTDLNELVKQYATVLESQCKEQQELVLELCPQPVVSKVDITQVEQVLLNLATNAAEAIDGPGRIKVRTGTQTITNVDQIDSLYGTRSSGGDFCFIEVSDTGRGISKVDLERVFEPFFTSSRVGRGLGLSVVYGVVESHEGLINCDSSVGEGTSFRVLVPMSDQAPELIDPNEYQRPHLEFGGLMPVQTAEKVLVIDDEESVLDLCCQLLKVSGWEAIPALGGRKGLSEALEYGDEISCILTDVLMPEMGASELLRELEEHGITTPVVLMSGYSQTRLDFFLDLPNVVSIVQKPFRAVEIKSAIQEAIDRSCSAGQRLQGAVLKSTK